MTVRVSDKFPEFFNKGWCEIADIDFLKISKLNDGISSGSLWFIAYYLKTAFYQVAINSSRFKDTPTICFSYYRYVIIDQLCICFEMICHMTIFSTRPQKWLFWPFYWGFYTNFRFNHRLALKFIFLKSV